MVNAKSIYLNQYIFFEHAHTSVCTLNVVELTIVKQSVIFIGSNNNNNNFFETRILYFISATYTSLLKNNNFRDRNTHMSTTHYVLGMVNWTISGNKQNSKRKEKKKKK